MKELELTDPEVDNDPCHDENDNEHDNDNDNVFRSGSESPGFHMVQLPVFEETKQRRATVSGGKCSLYVCLCVYVCVCVCVWGCMWGVYVSDCFIRSLWGSNQKFSSLSSNQSNNQSVNQAISESVNQQAVNQPINQSVIQRTNESNSQ